MPAAWLALYPTAIRQNGTRLASMAISITIPVVESSLISKVLGIMNETDSTAADGDDPTHIGGNEDFVFDFYLGTTHFEDKPFKLTMADFGAAVNDVPAIKLGFIK